MAESNVKIATAFDGAEMQIAHLNTSKVLEVIPATFVQFSTTHKQYVVMVSLSGTAWVKVSTTAGVPAPTAGDGFPLLQNVYYHTTIEKDEYISSTLTINLTALGAAGD